MFITKLNKLFEKHGRIAFIIMFFVIIGPFVLIVGPTSLSDAFRNDNSIDTVKIKGKTYTENDLLPYIQMVKYQRFITGTATNDDDFILPAAVEFKLLLDYAKSIKIPHPTIEEIRNSIRSQLYYSDPKTGKFSQQYFEFFKAQMLYQIQITPREYDTIITNELILRKLNEKIIQEISQTITDEQVATSYQERQSSLEVFYKNYRKDDFIETAKTLFNNKYPTQETKNVAYQTYFDQHIAPLREIIEHGLIPPTEENVNQPFQYKGNDAVYAAAEFNSDQVQRDKNLTIEQKRAKIQEMNTQLAQYGIPFFRHEQKRVNYVFFPIEVATDISLEDQTKIYEQYKESNFKNQTKEDALKQIANLLGRQKGTESAKTLAIAFHDEMYKQFSENTNIEKSFNTIANKLNKEIKTSTFFDDNSEIGGIEDFLFRAEVYKNISQDMPVSQPILGANGYYIAIWKESIAPHFPIFDLKNTNLIRKIDSQMQEEKALELAIAQGKNDFAKIEKLPVTEIAKIAKELKIEKLTCTRQTAPSEIVPQGFLNQLEHIVGKSKSTEYDNGFALIYLASITPASTEAYEKDKASFKTKVIEEKTQEANYKLSEQLHQEYHVEFLPKRR